MTEREQEQAKGLKAHVVDAGVEINERDRIFINHMEYNARQRKKKWMSDAQRSYLRALLVTFSPELFAAGKRELIFTEAPKATSPPGAEREREKSAAPCQDAATRID